MSNSSNREQWLIEASKELEKHFFFKATKSLPSKLAVSCGIPKGPATAIGQCWDPKVSSDGTTHIFVCPSLDDPYKVLETLLHELCHAVIGTSYGHGKEFGRIARSVGLEGKLTSTKVTPESKTGKLITSIQEALGDYPHKALNKRPTKKIATQPKRVTLVSPRDEEYKVSIKAALLSEGHPLDPWGNSMEIKE